MLLLVLPVQSHTRCECINYIYCICAVRLSREAIKPDDELDETWVTVFG